MNTPASLSVTFFSTSLTLKNDLDTGQNMTEFEQLLCLLDNLSYNKVATQSHSYADSGYEASNAVDGNPATCMRTLEIGHTSPQKTVWWMVDLGGIYTINSINILFRIYDGQGIKLV